jgi:DNA-binding response OmpR family regulator
MSRTPRVLVVEDEHDIAALVKHTLERSGDAQVQTVASGDVALRVAMEEPPDLSSSHPPAGRCPMANRRL